MTKEIISTKNAPQAIGPYSQAIKAGNLIFISGQIPLDPETGDLVTKSIEVLGEVNLSQYLRMLIRRDLKQWTENKNTFNF